MINALLLVFAFMLYAISIWAMFAFPDEAKEDENGKA